MVASAAYFSSIPPQFATKPILCYNNQLIVALVFCRVHFYIWDKKLCNNKQLITVANGM